MDEIVISEKPTALQKGFKRENLRIVHLTSGDVGLSQRIEACRRSMNSKLTKGDQGIVERVANSYRKLGANDLFDEEDFVLNGHELVETQKISDSNLLRYVVYRYKYNKYPELKVAEDYPPCIQIEPTSICNYRCIMCYQADETFSRKSSGHMGYMTLDKFKNIIDQVAGNIEAVTFASRGEPLLHAQITEMLDYCRGKFLGLKINTNASLLTERNIHALLSSDLQTIVFSVDAADAELYEKIRVNGKFDAIKKNIERFSEIRAKQYADNSVIVRVSGVKINGVQDVDKMRELWGGFADIVGFTNYNPWQDSYHNPVNDLESPCTELWRRMFVWWDGQVNPCDFDYKSQLSRWTVEKSTISEIWRSVWYEELRAKHLFRQRNKIEPCNRCVAI